MNTSTVLHVWPKGQCDEDWDPEQEVLFTESYTDVPGVHKLIGRDSDDKTYVLRIYQEET